MARLVVNAIAWRLIWAGDIPMRLGGLAEQGAVGGVMVPRASMILACSWADVVVWTVEFFV